jgi:hypothetical protein
MLGGSLVTTAWRVLRSRMEEKAFRYGEKLQIYWISSRGQPTRGDPLALGLGVGLTTLTVKNVMCYEMFQSASDLDWFFGTT